MITKAIVIDKLDNKYKVRIPLYDGAGNAANALVNEDLNWAVVSTPQNIRNPFKIGDVVIVSWEHNRREKPIILGALYLEDVDRELGNQIDYFLRSLTTTGITKLSEQTSIGDVSPSDLSNVKGLAHNAQGQINEIKRRLKKIETQLGIKEDSDE